MKGGVKGGRGTEGGKRDVEEEPKGGHMSIT
jgi:hypothetical protein